MAEIASAYVSLLPSAKGFGTSAQRQIGPQMTSVAKTTGSRFGSAFATAARNPLKTIGLAAVGLFAVRKVKEFFQGAVAEAREAQKVSAITAQVIKSTGGAANISAGQVGRLAASISNLTGIDDEAIQAGSNLLLTFTNLRNEAGKGNDVFNQATSIITDMSVALGTDMKSSAIQVGKALNDPIKGISALTRVGVAFTEQQKEQITRLTESGKRLEAQKIILAELNKEFGGTAAAAATAGDRFKVAYANFQETIGTALLPTLDRLLLKGVEVIGFLQSDVPPAFERFRAAIAPVAEIIGTFVTNHLPAFQTALAALGGSALTSVIGLLGGGLLTALTLIVGALTSPIALIGALAGAAIYAYLHFENFRTSVNNLAAFMQANVLPALVSFGSTLRADVLPVAIQFGTWLATKAYPALINFWIGVGQKLQPSLVALGETFRADILPALKVLFAELQQHRPALTQIAALVVKLQLAYASLSASVLGKVLPPIIRLTGFLIGSHLTAVASVIDLVFKWIGVMARLGGELANAGQAVGRFATTVRAKFADAVAFAKAVPDKMVAALRAGVVVMVGVGKDLVAGFITGIKAMASSVLDAVGGVIDGAINFAKGKLKIGSPSKLFHQFGSWTAEGLANGIVAGTPGVVAAVEDMGAKAQKAILGNLTAMRDGVKSIIDGLKSDFASLRDTVAGAFTGDLFGAENSHDFLLGLVNTKSNLQALKKAFRKLIDWGVSPQFLSQLFSSGNGGLILDLASGDRISALTGASLFQDIGNLSGSLGGQVANADIGPKIDRTNQRLERIEKALDRLPARFGRELNGAVSHGNRRAS